MRFEEYIKENEISQSRTPKEFINWFEHKLGITKKQREALKTQNILHKGIAKIFYEELFPLYRLFQNKLEEWKNVKFKPIIGNQNYDVEVESDADDVPQQLVLNFMSSCT